MWKEGRIYKEVRGEKCRKTRREKRWREERKRERRQE